MLTIRHHTAHLLRLLADHAEPEPSHINEGILDNGNHDTTGFFLWNGATYIGRRTNGGPDAKRGQ